jgi:hypothetical protein
MITIAHSPKCIFLAAMLAFTDARAGSVTLINVHEKGVQPQALVDGKGVLHLVYLAGPTGKSDIFHTTFDSKTKRFGKVQQVNHTHGNGMATGTIRGAQCMFGKDDRLHIVWNGEVTGPDGKRQSNVF